MLNNYKLPFGLSVEIKEYNMTDTFNTLLKDYNHEIIDEKLLQHVFYKSVPSSKNRKSLKNKKPKSKNKTIKNI